MGMEHRYQPALLLAVSFVVAIVMGTILLILPFSTVDGQITFLDALFTATSAVCVTGLIVQDTAAFFTPAGQVVILVLFQIGGLGILTFSTLILLVSGKRISFTDRLILQQDFLPDAPGHVSALVKNIFVYTLSFELVGTVLLAFRWHAHYGFPRGVFVSFFHSVSAFCNAGFSVFSDSLREYQGDVYVNAVLILLIVFGGLGFLVHLEVRQSLFKLIRGLRFKVSLHTKLVLRMTLGLILVSLGLFLIIEWEHALQGLPISEKIISALFQVITPRTAGFNTMDLNTLGLASTSLLVILMFIGASPGSTGGGVKTSTVGVILAFLRSKLAARESVHLFYRTLPQELISRAYTVVTLGICVIAAATFLLSLGQPDATMEEIVFEVFSAFGTVGLSLGLTPKLHTLGKLVIIVTMYIGRIGPLSLLLAFSRSKARGQYEYAEERVMIG
jgi:trk system potassium uptake protein TrkH